MNRRSVPFAAALVLVFSAVTASAQEVVTTPGQANLEIKLTNSTAEILAYLAAYPVQAITWEDDELPVRLYRLGESDPAAMAEYEVGTTQPDPLATKVVMPDVPAEGSTFLVEVEELYLSGGALYRVGTDNAASAARILCGPVMRVADDPGGLDCEISECAALVNLQVSLAGVDADLDALDETLPVRCSATAWVEELFMTGSFNLQARSAWYGFDLDELRDGVGEIPILMRGDGSRVRVGVSCSPTVEDGETGFVLLPGSSRTPLDVAILVTPTCDQVTAIDVPLQVERTAGVLKGLFDISGRTETATEVWFKHNNYRFRVEPSIVPAWEQPDPDDPWIFEGAPSTCPLIKHDVGARALIDDGFRYLELPHRRGLNDEVEVPTAGTTDLGTTFVALPQVLTGTVVLDDRAAGLGLDQLNTDPFTYLTDYAWRWSYISADGQGHDEQTAEDGKSGDGGLARSILQGSYDATEGKTFLSYELLLAGLSDDGLTGGQLDQNSPLDGRGAAPTPWLVEDLSFFFEDSAAGTWQQLRADIGILLPRTTEPIPDYGPPAPLEPIPRLRMCLGEVGLTFRTDPTVAMLYSPRIWASYDDLILTIPDDPYSLFELEHSYAYGTPRSIADRAEEATVTMLLPAGARYRIGPSVRIASPDGSTSNYAYLGGLRLPLEGDLVCGSSDIPCGTVTEDGEVTTLAIGVTPPVPACHESGNLAFDVIFEADAQVTLLTLQIDSNPVQVLCNPCPQVDGVTQPVSVTATIPADEASHTLRLRAEDEIGCVAWHDITVYVPSQPLSLQCAPDFTCTVPSADVPLAADHDCIQTCLAEPMRVGGCNYDLSYSNDGPAFYPEGSTDVTFTSIPGDATCTTAVTVARAPGYQLAYAEGNLVKIRNAGNGLYHMNQTVPYAVTWLEFDRTGERLAAAVDHASPAVRVFDVDDDSVLYDIQTHPMGRNVAFHPEDNHVLATVFGDATGTRYWIGLYKDDQEKDLARLDRHPFMSLPEIAWHRDGDRLLGIFGAPNVSPGGVPVPGYTIRLYDWKVFMEGLQNPNEWARERTDTPREEPFQLLYNDLPGIGLYGSIRGASVGGGTALAFASEVANEHMDLAREGSTAAFVKYEAGGVRLSVVKSIGDPSLLIDPGPLFPGPIVAKPLVEMSEDGRRIAVSLGDRIEILEYPGYVPIATFDASGARHLRFRPKSEETTWTCE